MKTAQSTVRRWHSRSHEQAPGRPKWKPLPFSPLYILLISLLHILCIIGITLISHRRSNDEPQIDLIRANITITTSNQPTSIFLFEESDVSAYLAWQYLPVALVTILAILWESVDVTVRRLEPFRQLALPQGGDVHTALCLDYVSMLGYLVPLAAIRRRHWAVAISSTVYILSSTVLPVLAGGIWSIEWASLSYSADRVDGPKYASISMSRGLATATQTCSGVAAAAGLILAAMLHFRATGLYRDPKGIGGIASLISDLPSSPSHNTLRLFRQIPSYAHSNVIRHALAGISFHLSHIPVTNPDGSPGTAYQLTSTINPSTTALPIPAAHRSYNPSRLDSTGFWLTRRAVVLTECIFWLAQAAITTAVYKLATFAGADAATSKPTVAKMVFTLTITIGGMMWQSIQREVQVFEPWRRLSLRERGPRLKRETVDSDTVSLGLLGSAVAGGLVGAWSAFSMGMVYVATIFLPPLMELAYSAGMINTSPFPSKQFGVMTGSPALGLAVTGVVVHIVIFVNMVFLIWSGRTKPFVPRRPTTLASQIVYLCRSERLLGEFRGLSMVGKREVSGRLGRVERWCRFGWFQTVIGGGSWWFVGVEEVRPGEPWWEFQFEGRGLTGVL